VAVLLLLLVPVKATGDPKFTPSTTNCTEPEGCPVEPADVLVTVVVKVTAWPNTDGLAEGVTVVVVVAGLTVKVAVAVLPGPPSLEVTTPVVLTYPAAAVPVTVTLNWHWPLVAIVAPVNVIPVGAVVVSVPPHTVDVPLATVSPVGSVSVNATPVRVTPEFGFVMVNCNEVVAFSTIVFGLNALAMLGGLATVRFAVAVFPVPPLVELTFPVVFVYWPEVAPVTVTLNWQVPFTAMLAPTSAMFPGAVVVNVPPHTVDVELPTVRPVGNTSVNATPASGTVLAAGLVIVKVSEVAAFNGMLVGLNALAIEGGATTVRFAVAVFPVPPLVELTAPVVLVNDPAVVPVTVTVN
jgi:hypothetical protein